MKRWTNRRYSLSRLFLNFYLLALLVFGGITFFADVVISSSVKGITDDYTRRFMRGTILLIEEDLARYPESDWQKRIKELDEKFSYHIELTPRRDLPLGEMEHSRLEQGEMVVVHDGEVMYHAFNHGQLVLVVGPLSPDRNQEELQRKGIPLELRIQLLTWGVVGLLLAVVLWFGLRPVWRDLESLRQTARAFGDGQLDARTREIRSQLFTPLAETLDGMAERIQQLIATHKELSSAISHELRTPIARMRFALEMLEDAEDLAERQRLSTMMAGDLDELDNLIDTSLTYARFEREMPALHLQNVNITEWLEDEVDNLRPLGRHLAISTDFSAIPMTQIVALDPRVMNHAVRNLLRNAIKYANKEIQISAYLESQANQATNLVLNVDDDGIGVPENERERIFSAFTRLDRSRDRATGGYGLGLAITRRAVELHGGKASVSASPLGGARFTLCWEI